MAAGGCELVRKWLKMASRWPQDGAWLSASLGFVTQASNMHPNMHPKMGPDKERWIELVRKQPKTASRWPQDGAWLSAWLGFVTQASTMHPTMSLDMGPDKERWAGVGPKTAQDGLKMAPRRCMVECMVGLCHACFNHAPNHAP